MQLLLLAPSGALYQAPPGHEKPHVEYLWTSASKPLNEEDKSSDKVESATFVELSLIAGNVCAATFAEP